MAVAVAALTAAEVEFEAGIAAADGGDGSKGRSAQGGTAEIGMEKGAAGIDDGTQRRQHLGGDGNGGSLSQCLDLEFGTAAGEEFFPHRCQGFSGGGDNDAVGSRGRQGEEWPGGEEAVDGRELPEEFLFAVHGLLARAVRWIVVLGAAMKRENASTGGVK